MVKTKEWTVPSINPSSSATVVIKDNEDIITIKWLCGDTVAFTRDGLYEALENFERVNLVPNLLWHDTAKSTGYSQVNFYARLEGKEFKADGMAFSRAPGVLWSDLRKALVSAIGKDPAK